MTRKKILYFDYWTIGIRNFKIFDKLLKAKGFDTLLIHLNSWRGIDGPAVQEIDGITCHDIKYYHTNLLFKVLEIERPDAVLMLNASFITDRTVILTCKRLNIK